MLHRTLIGRAGPVLALLLVITVPVMATTVQYSDRPSWEAATPGFTNIDFEGIVTEQGGWASYSDAAGLTVADVQFIGLVPPSSYALYVVNPVPGSDYDFESGSLLKGPYYFTGTSKLIVNLPAGVTSFGADLMTLDDSNPATFTVHLSTGEEWTDIATAARPTRTFFGVTSDTAITQIDFVLTSGTNSVTYAGLDNFSYGVADLGGGGEDPAETPEAATMILVGTGLIAVFGFRRRRFQSAV